MDQDPTTRQDQDELQEGGQSASTKKGSVSSMELLQGKRELQIEHAGDIYRLRVTKAGKLILTK